MSGEGVSDAVYRVLLMHKGRGQAISRDDLVKGSSRLLGFPVHERAVRDCINGLRKSGFAICSAGGEDGGYWMAADWQELLEFTERELHSRAMDLLEQEKALKNQAEQTWGRYAPGHQYSLEI